MFRYKNIAMGFTAVLLAIFIAGCQNDDDDDKKGGSSDSTAPMVLSTHPASGAADVPTNTNIIARFSEAMKASTINDTTFTVTGPGTTPVTGSVSYDAINHVAEFLPAANLAATTQFTATISVDAQDSAGNSLVSPYSWGFMTGSVDDTTPPTITAVSPADASTDVPLNKVVTATFSEQMDSTTINATSFTLMNGATSIPGTVSCPGSSASFTPTNDLPSGVTLTATITTDAEDLASNPMAVDYVWTFDTGTASAEGPAPVNLGTAENYVILAKSGVSTTGTSALVGDVGLSPYDQTGLTGFSETMDASNEFSTSTYVNGSLFAADYAPPTPTILTTAVLDMETAYNDAKNRVLPDHLNLGAGNVQGMTLTPGLYKWETSLSIPSAVTISGGANDVWIFQITEDLLVGNGAIVTLTGGALPKNIFWQVTGQTTLGTTSDFKGVVLCATAIVLQTGAVMNGRALAQTAVTIDDSDITQP